ncbi:MAG: glycosyltransferase 87 family protein [Actinomycetota bacterium]|nr:glycosyltransferase 87 family protein [Actinomycetota bacterium]MDA3035619.1 glycosyltransferase 87 family protein [Actinomycetota bacterium]
MTTRGEGSAWGPAVRVGFTAYLMSRLLVLAGAGLVAVARTQEQARAGLDRRPTLDHVRDTLMSWDAAWYQRIVDDGYPRSVPADVTFYMEEARAAFFPGFPYLARVADVVIPGGSSVAMLVLNVVLGWVAVWACGHLARQLWGVEVATAAMVIVAIFPGSFVLSMGYSEALMLSLTAGCLVMLLRERWVWAGVLGLVATATRPNAVALVLAALVMVWMVRDDAARRWRALATTAVIPIGFVMTQWLIGWRAGEAGVWFRVQREAWDEGLSLGVSTARFIYEFIVDPLASPTRAITAASVIVVAGGVWAMWRTRTHPVVVAYTLGVVALMLSPATVTARPRFVLVAIGVLIAPVAWWLQNPQIAARHRRSIELVAVGALAAGLTASMAVYGLEGAIP